MKPDMSPSARHRRMVQRTSRLTRAAERTPPDSPERARLMRWRPVMRALDARIWPLVVAAGHGRAVL